MIGRNVQTSPGLKLGVKARLGYGLGGFAFNLYFTTATLFLLYYYTDILGLSPATAGWVFAVALIWDALFDPVMGYLANRTRTRWGSYRPYLLFGAVPLGASWALMFLPSGLKGGSLVLLTVATHILFRTLYAVSNMPYLALSAVLTTDSRERGVLAGLQVTAGGVCGLTAALFTLVLVGLFGHGQLGFFWTGALYGALGAVLLLVVFALTHETVLMGDTPQLRLRDLLRMMAANRAFWIVGVAMLLSAVGSTFFQKILPYYLKYSLRRADLIGPALGILAASVTLSIPFWTWTLKHISKQLMWLAGTIVGVVGSIMLWLSPNAPGPILLALAPVGWSAGAGFLGFWAMMPDTVEYGEWRTRVRAEGPIFGIVSLIQKASLGLAAAGLGEALAAVGYRANVAQTSPTLAAMRLMMIALPGALSILAGVVVMFYPMDRHTHGRMLRVLERRRARAAAVS